MPEFLVLGNTPVSDAVLNVIAHLPTTSLKSTVHPDFFAKLGDRDYMRLAVLLATKGYDEGGCPIGAVIVDNASNQILGKGHNTLVQENHPYNHGETSAIRDAGRRDFSNATMYTSLSPCMICAALVHMRGFPRLVVGNAPGGWDNDEAMREHGVTVQLLEDPLGVALYDTFQKGSPELDMEDRFGVAGRHKHHPDLHDQ